MVFVTLVKFQLCAMLILLWFHCTLKKNRLYFTTDSMAKVFLIKENHIILIQMLKNKTFPSSATTSKLRMDLQ